MEHEPEVAKVLDGMRLKMAEVFGVTVTGNRCTVRWTMDGQLVDVHMIIENVTTPDEHRQHMEQYARMEALLKKYEKKFPDLREELAHAETGEWSK
jgi:hypothetical protein